MYDQAKGWPITTGPYGVGVSTDQQTNFDMRPTWWAADTGFVPKYPDVWRLTSIPYTNDTLGAQQLINKEIDQPLDLRPFVVASTLAQADHLTTWTGRKPPYGYLDWWPISVQFCTMKPPFDNPKVRWAVAYALDQQKVVDIAWGGAGTVANEPIPQLSQAGSSDGRHQGPHRSVQRPGIQPGEECGLDDRGRLHQGQRGLLGGCRRQAPRC